VTYIFDYLSKIILAVITCSSIVYAASQSMSFSVSALNVLWLSFIFITFLAIMFYNKLSSFISSIILISGVLVFSLSLLLSRNLLNKAISAFQNYYIWVEDCFFYEAASNRFYELLFTLLVCFIVAIPIFIFTVKRFNFIVILVGGLTFFIIQWVYDYLNGYNSLYLFVAAIIVYYLNHIYLKYSKKEAAGNVHTGLFILWTLPLSILIIVASLAFPAKENPIEWKWLDTKVNNVYDFFDNIYLSYKSLEYFSIESTGFGYSRGKLGGKASLSDTLVLSVISPRSTYLKGSSLDTYTGNSWNNSDNSRALLSIVLSGSLSYITNNEKNEYDLLGDTLESRVGPYYLSNQFKSIEDYSYVDKITIRYEDIRTKSLFVPIKTSSFDDSQLTSGFYSTSSGLIISDKSLNKGLTYSVTALSLKTTDENFINLLRRSKKGVYLGRPSSISISDQYRFLSYRTNYNYSRYLQLPPALPQRVSDLAKTLTEKLTNNYDKVKAIEQHLASNYPYTLTPKAKPRNQDFVDFFLFDGKEGYCTYYASAMTVMVRSIGIPARYVEGYMMPPSKDPETGSYLVTNKRAHSWVEVYFEGFGWVPFEPTAPFTSIFYQQDSFQGSFTNDFLNNPETETYKDELSSYIGDDLGPSIGVEQSKRLLYIISITFIFTILIFIFLLCLFNYIRSKAIIFKAMKMQPKQSVLFLYAFYIKILSAQKLGIQSGETPNKYAERVDRNVYYQPISFKKLTSIFVKARYSKIEINDEEKTIFCDFYRAILERAVYNMGRFNYFVYMFLRIKQF